MEKKLLKVGKWSMKNALGFGYDGCHMLELEKFKSVAKFHQQSQKGEEDEENRMAIDYESKALRYAERIGVYEYKVNGKFMEYWSFYDSEGWYFVRIDLDEMQEVFRGAHIPWNGDKKHGIPSFLKTESGAVLYNYNVG